jgi:hypothetical protein
VQDDVCVIVPPSDAKAPCYQGSNSDTDKCYQTDPLLVDGVTKSCGTCEKFGFSTYIRNDPLYKTMSLYERDAAKETATAPAYAVIKTQCIPPGGNCIPFSTDCCGAPCPGGWQFACP